MGEPPIATEPAPASETPKPARTRRARKAKAEGDQPAEVEIPEGTVGRHANGKFACEVCGAEFESADEVTSHYIEAHAS